MYNFKGLVPSLSVIYIKIVAAPLAPRTPYSDGNGWTENRLKPYQDFNLKKRIALTHQRTYETFYKVENSIG